ncbi:12 kDa triple gene block protein [Indian citrus ringspot virus]|uniref:Movement protein TGB2 n=1 Tax=Indian citrus ringspot virus (isolate Kinnow mandarin/India/K1/1996) TaxID=651357 RepID=TGB2_ICRSV|nr:12 kDa triple gene block protein [Indian citrus ringspot virus]Q918W1.1 RecName: Full=Movement protein TGB2; AltName: Full=Triple gene block 2 protein; Short=TGBp2 [Indian citrus ringspot virus K1]AAK97524.1 12 kDa triple gene block protein [Indian citrus ringspot virus]
MPLQPPPDHTWAVRIIALGLAVTALIFTSTRDTSRHVGDPSHSLPFGGHYRDGSKVIHYNSPRSSKPSNHTPYLLFAPIGIILLIHALHRLGNSAHICRCTHCMPHSQT